MSRSRSRSIDLHDHYLNCAEIAENLKDFFPDNDGLSYEEVLLQQACMYQSFEEGDKSKGVATPTSGEDWSHLLEEDEGVLSQEAIDEALARSLQEGFDDLLISESGGSASGSTESRIQTPSRGQAASSDMGQDSIDPDSMEYEELVHLGEAIGVENRGISAAHFSRLPTSKYRSGLFSKNKKEKCVICQMDFNSGERLTTLPCIHHYHTECIGHWLKLNKNCPICQKEVI